MFENGSDIFVSKFEPYVNALQIYSNALPLQKSANLVKMCLLPSSLWVANLVQYLPLLLSKFEQNCANVEFPTFSLPSLTRVSPFLSSSVNKSFLFDFRWRVHYDLPHYLHTIICPLPTTYYHCFFTFLMPHSIK